MKFAAKINGAQQPLSQCAPDAGCAARASPLGCPQPIRHLRGLANSFYPTFSHHWVTVRSQWCAKLCKALRL